MARLFGKAKVTKGLFRKARDPVLASKISIRTPNQFRKSIRTLKRNGISTKERRALVLARTRAKLQLRRKNLSSRERRQFSIISNTNIPRRSTRGRR